MSLLVIENKEENQVMIDIETLGTSPGSVVASIGLVRFQANLGRVQTIEELQRNSLKVVIDISESLKQGFIVDGDTLRWWFRQSPEAQKATFEDKGMPIGTALIKLQTYFRKDDFVWGNGANFDIPLAEAYFNKWEMAYPWKYSNVRCYRTTRNQHYYDETLVPNNPLLHDCVADSIYQAQVVQAIALANPQLKWK